MWMKGSQAMGKENFQIEKDQKMLPKFGREMITRENVQNGSNEYTIRKTRIKFLLVKNMGMM